MPRAKEVLKTNLARDTPRTSQYATTTRDNHAANRRILAGSVLSTTTATLRTCGWCYSSDRARCGNKTAKLMAKLPIVTYPDPRLKEVCAPVATFDRELHTLLDDMRETMYAANGIGLAAPQIGRLERIAVVDVSPEGNDPLELINPEIIEQEGSTDSEEGCLSIPDYRDTVKRHRTVTVRAYDRHGEQFEIEADGLFAICLQHEIDHLNGVLFVDRMSRLKRELFKRWAKKHLDQGVQA